MTGLDGVDYRPGDRAYRPAAGADLPTEWLKRQTRYWDTVAPVYDRHYSTEWSAGENAIVAARLSRLLPDHRDPRVLDLGCGTGLGYHLLTELRPHVNYTGVDASAGMLEVFRKKFDTDVHLINQPAEWLAAGRFADLDLVIAIFTSASYIDLPLPDLLERVGGWIKPSGGIYLSFLNRMSIGSLGSTGFGRVIDYSSRGMKSGTVPARRYSTRELIETCRALGLTANVVSLGPFAGLVESRLFMKANAVLSNSSLFGHTIDVVITGRG
ncbi:class I SAM-dependent methyltransferase [Nocardia sp. CA2R105]|uniref:class I SAM-dependent DNA methyltransferase n=1 Tax=Nocardia coffeae TaxID=2873381 RepID=UPI001CA778D6|nr:class I SAM-dependent methyltransferase [Nocardia coffeae]MBY8858788.1 class I SAM-dependent methyltransferase [Nocardia coffeae]